MSDSVGQDARLTPAATQYSPAGVALMSILLFVDSLHFVFARALAPHLDPSISTLYIMGIATIQVGVFGLWQRRLQWNVLRTNFWFFSVIGVLIGVSTLLNYAAVNFIDAGTASMLGKTSILFSLLLSILWLHDRLTSVQIAGAVIAIVGVFVITFQPGDYLRLGSLMVVFSTSLYAFHTAVVKRSGEGIEFVTFFFFRLLFTTVVIAAFAISRPVSFLPKPNVGLLLFLAATVDVVLSRSLYYLALRRLQMSMHAIILTISPVAAVFWSYLLFNTFPQPSQLVGGMAVLAGVLLATLHRND